MTEWRIRAATRDDRDLVAELEAAAFGAASWGVESVRQGLCAPYVSGLLAIDGAGAPAGFALWRRLGRDAEILSIGTHPAARRRGAARALVAGVLADAAGHGCSTMFLEVDAANAPARDLYEKHDFEIIGRRRSYYRNGADALVLRRYL